MPVGKCLLPFPHTYVAQKDRCDKLDKGLERQLHRLN